MKIIFPEIWLHTSAASYISPVRHTSIGALDRRKFSGYRISLRLEGLLQSLEAAASTVAGGKGSGLGNK